MRILCIDPAADWSTRDVFDGLVGGLKAAGHEVLPYYFGRRFGVLRVALEAHWRRRGRTPEERGTRPRAADAALWASELAVTWALRHDPDWIVIVSGMYFHPDALAMLKQCRRRDGSPVRVSMLLTETPYDAKKEAFAIQFCDVAWTNERTGVRWFQNYCRETSYLRHGFNADVHKPGGPLDPDVPAHDVVFVGTGFQERVEILEAVDWTGIDFGLYGFWRLRRKSPLRQFVRQGAVDNTTTTMLHRRAKIALNLFRSSCGFAVKAPRIEGAESLGPRSYELAASGVFTLSEYRPEVEETFGRLVPTFRNASDLQMLLRRFLTDDSGRRSIAAQLPATVSGHSWTDRARQVVADLERVADCVRDAPVRDMSVEAGMASTVQ